MTTEDATRAATVASWWPWLALPVLAASLVTLGLTLDLVDHGTPYVRGETWFLVPASVGLCVVAAGIWSTRPHPHGVTRLGVLYTVSGLGCAVAIAAYGWSHQQLAGTAAVSWVSNWIWVLGAPPLLAFGALLYPDGRLPGRRWWPVAAAGAVAVTGLVLTAALAPGRLDNLPSRDNPVGVGPATVWDAVAGISFPLLLLTSVGGIAALVVRFARAPQGADTRGQIAGFALAAGLLAVAAALPSRNGPEQTLLALTSGAALPTAIGYAVLRHRLIDQRSEVAGLQRRVSSLTSSRRELASEREDERANLRRELHDGLGPSLAAIGLGLRQLETAHDPAAVHALADEVQRAVGEVRRISAGLRPDVLDSLDLATALKESLAALDRFGPRIEVSAEPLPTLTRATEVAVFRIVMEAATNAVRHAGASRVVVRVWDDDGVRISVTDDGHGLTADLPSAGEGLTTMRTRAEELGGRLAITSGSDGTTVEAWLPGEAEGT